MATTRKLPVAIDLKSGRTGSEHLIPQLHGFEDDQFIGVARGKFASLGVVAYLGRAVSPEDLLERFAERNEPYVARGTALESLERYVTELQEYKIGNVVSISYDRSGRFELRKIAERPPSARTSLPE